MDGVIILRDYANALSGKFSDLFFKFGYWLFVDYQRLFYFNMLK